MQLKKFYPALLIVIPLLTVATFSSASGNFFGSIANAGYGGQYGSCPDVSTMTLTPSSATVAPGATIDFNGRNFGTEQDVIVYLNGTQVGKAHADGGGNFTTGSMTMPTTSGTYTYSFVGVNCNTPMTSTITVSGNGSSTGGSTGDNGGVVITSNPTITPQSQTVSPSQHIDFTGHNFAHEENVTISLNGAVVGNAHADGGGNFTTGSMTMPTTPGSYTYTFLGTTSNTPVTSTITVH